MHAIETVPELAIAPVAPAAPLPLAVCWAIWFGASASCWISIAALVRWLF